MKAVFSTELRSEHLQFLRNQPYHLARLPWAEPEMEKMPKWPIVLSVLFAIVVVAIGGRPW